MDLLYYRDPIGNFGDDLNEVMWKTLLPAKVFDVPDSMLMGIGSIFNAERAPLTTTQGKRMFVLGSGAGYGPLPPGWENWTILGCTSAFDSSAYWAPGTGCYRFSSTAVHFALRAIRGAKLLGLRLNKREGMQPLVCFPANCEINHSSELT